ncbi:MAG: polysaccharide pyruvyl transferase CsaB [Syntrophomonadaceae bacterium]|jgi:polysaccharide pyruvyl transferase CsaB|nr:polysaccharide pyruvyl transferase CsaB [Syntrophomonadaceae bacterium]
MRFVLSGYYGFDNAGDEALLTAIISSLRQLEPQAEFLVISGNPARTRAVHGVAAVSRTAFLDITRALRRADLLISGGGSLLQDITGPLSLPYYLGIMVMAHAVGTPVMLYAQGVGPITRRSSRCMIRTVVNRVNLVTLRDQDSLALLRSLGVTVPPCEVTADPVFALSAVQPASGRPGDLGGRTKWGTGKPVVAVSVRAWPQLGDYSPALAEVLDALAAEGSDIVFLSLHYPDDLAASRRVAARMKATAVLVEKKLGTAETMTLIAGSRLLIGMRLHSLIFAAAAGVPFLGIPYDPKVESLLREFGRPVCVKNGTLDAAALLQGARATLADWERESQAVVAQSEVLRMKARHTAELAVRLARSARS